MKHDDKTDTVTTTIQEVQASYAHVSWFHGNPAFVGSGPFMASVFAQRSSTTPR